MTKDEVKLDRLRAEIQTGLDQIENGEAVDGEQFFEELLNELKSAGFTGKIFRLPP